MKTQNSLTLASLLTITCLASQVQANLITNGGFEAPLVANVGQFLSIPGWTLDGSSIGTTFEIQNTNLGLGPAYQGAQYCELNSTGTTSMYQDIATVPGTYYNVSYAFSPRIGVTDNNLRFYWDGSLINTLSASGVGNTSAVWTPKFYNLKATGLLTRVQFDDLLDPNNSLGTFLDAVNVSTPEPGSVALLFGMATVGASLLRRRRK